MRVKCGDQAGWSIGPVSSQSVSVQVVVVVVVGLPGTRPHIPHYHGPTVPQYHSTTVPILVLSGHDDNVDVDISTVQPSSPPAPGESPDRDQWLVLIPGGWLAGVLVVSSEQEPQLQAVLSVEHLHLSWPGLARTVCTAG